MRSVVHGDNNDRPKDVTALAELVDNFVNDECGDVTVTAVQSLAHREREALNTGACQDFCVGGRFIGRG